MINIGNKIRELRRKRGITQEKLANVLNCSAQAVSKWEMNAGYPDITMLPIIAAYFEVSLDTLFDYDSDEIEEKIQKIIQKARNGGLSSDHREKTLLEGLSVYPGSVKLKRELLETYAYKMSNSDNPKLKENALALGEELVAESNDYLTVSSAKNYMAMINIKLGNYDKAKKIIDSLPYLYHPNISDRMRCSARWLKGEDKLKEAREWKVWALQDLFTVCESEGMGFWEKGDYENALLSFQEKVDVIDLFGRRDVPNEYRIRGGVTKQAFADIKIAACLYKLGRLKECDIAIEKAYSLFRNGWSEEQWGKFGKRLLNELRAEYNKMGLDEYKLCQYL